MKPRIILILILFHLAIVTSSHGQLLQGNHKLDMAINTDRLKRLVQEILQQERTRYRPIRSVTEQSGTTGDELVTNATAATTSEEFILLIGSTVIANESTSPVASLATTVNSTFGSESSSTVPSTVYVSSTTLASSTGSSELATLATTTVTSTEAISTTQATIVSASTSAEPSSPTPSAVFTSSEPDTTPPSTLPSRWPSSVAAVSTTSTTQATTADTTSPPTSSSTTMLTSRATDASQPTTNSPGHSPTVHPQNATDASTFRTTTFLATSSTTRASTTVTATSTSPPTTAATSRPTVAYKTTASTNGVKEPKTTSTSAGTSSTSQTEPSTISSHSSTQATVQHTLDAALLTLVFDLDQQNLTASLDTLNRKIFQLRLLVCHCLCEDYCTGSVLETLKYTIEAHRLNAFVSFFVPGTGVNFCATEGSPLTKQRIMYTLLERQFAHTLHQLIPRPPLAAVYSGHSLVYLNGHLNGTEDLLADVPSIQSHNLYFFCMLLIYGVGIFANFYLAYRLVRSEMIYRKLGSMGHFIRRSVRASSLARWLNGASRGQQQEEMHQHPRIGQLRHGRADIIRSSMEMERFVGAPPEPKQNGANSSSLEVAGAVTPTASESAGVHRPEFIHPQHTRF